MSRLLSYLGRGRPGAAFAGAPGFGTTQARAAPGRISSRTVCSPGMEAYRESLGGAAGAYCLRPTVPGGPWCHCD